MAKAHHAFDAFRYPLSSIFDPRSYSGRRLAADQRLVLFARVLRGLAGMNRLAESDDDVGPPAHRLPDLHLRLRLEPFGDVELRAAAELDHADALPAVQGFALARVEDD